jgi:hypothetical protein
MEISMGSTKSRVICQKPSTKIQYVVDGDTVNHSGKQTATSQLYLLMQKIWTVEYMYCEDAASNIYIIFRNTKIGSIIVSLMGTHHGVKVGPNITSGSMNIGNNGKWIDFVPEPPKRYMCQLTCGVGCASDSVRSSDFGCVT